MYQKTKSQRHEKHFRKIRQAKCVWTTGGRILKNVLLMIVHITFFFEQSSIINKHVRLTVYPVFIVGIGQREKCTLFV